MDKIKPFVYITPLLLTLAVVIGMPIFYRHMGAEFMRWLNEGKEITGVDRFLLETANFWGKFNVQLVPLVWMVLQGSFLAVWGRKKKSAQ